MVFAGFCKRYLQHLWTSTFHFAWQLSFWLIIEALWNLNLSPAHLHHCFYSTQKKQKGKNESTQRQKKPKSIPNSQKKKLPNMQWVKYVYCPALLTLEVGRARRNLQSQHKHFIKFCGQYSRSSCEGFFPKELLSASLFTSSPNIHHLHLLCPLHHLHLL